MNATEVRQGELTILMIQDETPHYYGGEIEIPLILKQGFSVALKPGVSIEVLKPLGSDVGITSVNIADYLTGWTDGNSISYRLKETLSGVDITVGTGSLSVRDWFSKFGDLVVIVSQSASDTHLAGMVEVPVRISKGGVRPSLFKMKPGTYGVEKGGALDLSNIYDGLPANAIVSYKITTIPSPSEVLIDTKYLRVGFGATSSTVDVEFSHTETAMYASGQFTVSVTFRDAGTISLEYDDITYLTGRKFIENNLNVGGIKSDQKIIVNLYNATFKKSIRDGEAFVEGTHYDVKNVPSGLIMTVVKAGATTVEIGLAGNAKAHRQLNDIRNIGISWYSQALEGGHSLSSVLGSSKSDISIHFNDPVSPKGASFVYEAQGVEFGTGAKSGIPIFKGRTATYGGAIANGQTLRVSLSNADFTSDVLVGKRFVDGTHYAVTSMPSGLSMVIAKTKSNVAEITFSGAVDRVTVPSDIRVRLEWNTKAIKNAPSELFPSVARQTSMELALSNPPIHFGYVGVGLSSGKFVESGANNGTLKTNQKITVTLQNGTFDAGVVDGAAFTKGTHYTVSNVPAGGLAMVVSKNSATEAEITFTGAATSHAHTNDVGNITIAWDSDALIGSPTLVGVSGASNRNIAIDFKDPLAFSYAGVNLTGGKFVEAIKTNDGGLQADQKLTVTVVSGAFATSIADDGDFSLNTHYTVLNVPSGLTVKVVKKNATTAEVSFSGKAVAHGTPNDVNNVGLTWVSAALQGAPSLTSVVGTAKSDIAIDFLSPYAITYTDAGLTGGKFLEASVNDGSIGAGQKITVILSSDIKFSTAIMNGDIFAAGVYYAPSNVPDGLTMVVTKKDAHTAEITFDTRAKQHATANDVSNITLAWNPVALEGNIDLARVSGTVKNSIAISFLNPVVLAYTEVGLTGGEFIEDPNNVGGLKSAQSITVDLTGATFISGVANNTDFSGSGVHYRASNVPSGLTMRVRKISANKASIDFTGTAAAHNKTHDLSNITITWASAALTGGPALNRVVGKEKNDIAMSFLDPISFAYTDVSLTGGKFIENVGTNNGTLGAGQKITVVLVGGTFMSSVVDNADFTAGTHYTATNVPGGLTMKVTKKGSNAAEVTFTGSVTAHAKANDVSNVTLSWTSGALDGNPGLLGIPGAVKNDIAMSFLDPLSFTYAIRGLTASKFVEDISTNDGALKAGQSVLCTMVGGAFDAGVMDGSAFTAGGTHYTATNVPAGLAMVVTKGSATTAEITFTGKATSHVQADDVNNITITWVSAGLTGSPSLLGITGVAKSNMAVSFENAPSLTYANSGLTGGAFVEVFASNGNLAANQKIGATLGGAVFKISVADNADFTAGTHYTATNVPAGLTMKVTKKSATTADITFTGIATSHAPGDDVSNVTITWQQAALNGSASLVSGGVKNNISFDFSAPLAFTYTNSGLTSGDFTEDLANNGSLKGGQKITVTLSTGAFNAGVTVGSAFTAGGTHYTASNVPAGLAMVVTKRSATTAEITFTSSATNHNDANDVNNVTIIWKSGAIATSPSLSGVVGTTKSDIGINYGTPSITGFTYDVYNATLTLSGAYLTPVNFGTGTIAQARTAFEVGYNPSKIRLEGFDNQPTDGDTFLEAILANAQTNGGEFDPRNSSVTAQQMILVFSGQTAYRLLEQRLFDRQGTTAANNNLYRVVCTAGAFKDAPSATSTAQGSATNHVEFAYNGTPLATQVSVAEDVANPGQIGANVSIGIPNPWQYATGPFVEGTHYKFTVARPLPPGLTASMMRFNGTTVRLSFTGTATSHAPSDGRKVTFEWLPSPSFFDQKNIIAPSTNMSQPRFVNSPSKTVTIEFSFR